MKILSTVRAVSYPLIGDINLCVTCILKIAILFHILKVNSMFNTQTLITETSKYVLSENWQSTRKYNPHSRINHVGMCNVINVSNPRIYIILNNIIMKRNDWFEIYT